MQLQALQELVHKTRDARRTQTLPKYTPAERDTLIKKHHPDYRENAYRPIKFGPNAGEKTVRELAALLEGDSPVPADLDLTPAYSTDVLVVGGGGAEFGINAIFVTQYRRTNETARPLATATQVPVITLKDDDLAGLEDRITHEFRGKRVLVVGGGNSGCDVACESARVVSPSCDDEREHDQRVGRKRRAERVENPVRHGPLTVAASS